MAKIHVGTAYALVKGTASHVGASSHQGKIPAMLLS